jgi:hypothetical protein
MPQCLQTGGMQLPVSVEFLGLLDTVASVGVCGAGCRRAYVLGRRHDGAAG